MIIRHSHHLLPFFVDSRRSFPVLDCDPFFQRLAPIGFWIFLHPRFRLNSVTFWSCSFKYSRLRFFGLPLDMSAPRTDVASSIKVGDLFTLEPLSFNANTANDYIDKCATCVDSEDLCDILEEILDTLSDPDTPNTPERLMLVNLIQWTALKCSRKSIRLQNKEFKDYIRDIERLNRIPTAPAPTSQPKRKQAKHQTALPRKDVPSKKQAKSERTLPPNTTSRPRIGDAESSMEEGAPGASKDIDGFTPVGRNDRRLAPIVIDSQNNATELLDQIGKYCDTPLEGRFENGKLRVFPTSAEEHCLIQKYISDNKLRSHALEMAHNKQLKVVLRGLPTDFDQEEQESKGIFNIKKIGFFRVAVEPLNKSTMPPQCYRCQEFFHHSRFCARAPKGLKCSGGHLTSECTKSPRPRQSVQIAVARTLQTSRVAPRIPSMQNPTRTNRRRTSGRSERLRARKIKNSQHLPKRK
ncbi:RNA-directed DNA polymerase from mobile element jockey [Trichonephila clavipes]|nr:RNA-directed DNA polymerase from mobile element jockey [Trichonephila clavipes]